MSTVVKESELYQGLIIYPSQQLGEAGRWRLVSLQHVCAQLWTFVLATWHDSLCPVLLFLWGLMF